jgi:hypothetical protein
MTSLSTCDFQLLRRCGSFGACVCDQAVQLMLRVLVDGKATHCELLIGSARPFRRSYESFSQAIEQRVLRSPTPGTNVWLG